MNREEGPTKSAERAIEARRLAVGGRVQGVGFRPFVARLARELELTGVVGNDSRGVFIELEGPRSALDRFVARLRSELPPLARISRLEQHAGAPCGATRFEIVSSAPGARQDVEIAPDTATCADCRRELVDVADRRWRYPFINCTNCGPRYSIIEGVPYDRPQTTMKAFSMCPRCQAEYDDPQDRRYHAQPNACSACGPRVWLADAAGAEIETDDPIAACVAALLAGKIVAIKGLGGFHLACRADSAAAVERLRLRKGREAKPLALMIGSIAQARQLAAISPAAEGMLSTPARPIVLLPQLPTTAVAHEVAPDSDTLGLMLPYTPLHELLFAASAPPLVMTSGNASEEPLSSRNDEACARLARIADLFLLHDREIARSIDDSVVMALDGEDEPPLIIRRARGYVPEAIDVPISAAEPIVAVGGDLKSTLCVLDGPRAVLSEHLGDLEHPAAFRNYQAARDRLLKLLQVQPARVACDMHPSYHSHGIAHALGLPVTEVQHHHAHAAACMAEHGLEGPVLAISADGTGYGDDGAVWGGELLLCDLRGYRRVGQLRYAPLFGGDRAARESWRPALGHVVEALGERWHDALPLFSAAISAQQAQIAASRLVSAPRSSSLGRLFDAVAFLLRIAPHNRFEGDAAVRLEHAAQRAALGVAPLELGLLREEGRWQLDARPLLRALLERHAAAEPAVELARAFHLGVAAGFAEVAVREARAAGISQVVLSGGCMLNKLLLAQLSTTLRAAGLRVYRHERVPPGDGGLALGQAVVAAAQTASPRR